MLTLMGLLLPISGCVAMGVVYGRKTGRGGCHRGGVPAEQTAELIRLRAELTALRGPGVAGRDEASTVTSVGGGL